MTINVTVDTGNLDSLSNTMETRLSTIVRRYAFAVEAGAKLAIMGGPKSGRVYARPGGRSHQASAPGEAPANDRGFLAGSLRAAPAGRLSWRVSTDKRYGAALELGTERIAPRPFLAPALLRVKDGFVAAVAEVFK